MVSKKIAFSLVEIMVALIIVSCIVAALAPIVTKKLKSSGTTINSGSISEITTDCSSNPNFGSDCKLCTKSYCINCGINNCAADKYMDSKRCECKSCSEKYSDLCAACDSKGCLRCKSASYYINNGVCTICPTGSYCDGVNIYATCPGDGYYCDSTGIHKCAEKFSSACAKCDSNKCTVCNDYFFLSGGTCKACSDACRKCTSATECTKCQADRVLIDNSCTTKMCYDVITGCISCKSTTGVTNETKCAICSGKYFLNTSETCTLCNIDNCQRCIQNQDSPACELCNTGYYLNSSAKCSSCSLKFGAQCVSCNANQCLSCQRGYHLSDASTSNACEADDNKFNCSDSNFMQIGNLCMTRKNMGDSNILSIPLSIKTVNAGGDEICYASTEKCCWKGETAKPTRCDSENGGYSGCSRTVCDWDAAKEICAGFNYGGKTWRLPTNEELTNLPYFYSINLSENGLMLCDRTSGFSSAKCAGGHDRCQGSYDAVCRPDFVWSGTTPKTLYVYIFRLYQGSWIGPSKSEVAQGFSVRCVTEMDTGE